VKETIYPGDTAMLHCPLYPIVYTWSDSILKEMRVKKSHVF